MTVRSARLSRRLSVVPSVLLAALSASLLAPVSPASAAQGPAPEPQTRAVIADVHTDAIATFWDDGELVLGSKADTPSLGTRYAADDVWFHVDDDSRIEGWPAGYGFVAPEGSTVWLAPEVQQAGQIWPGFSTESVPQGTLDGDDTTLTLVGVEGPGEVELWQTGSFGAVNRLWSSDEEGFTSFTRKRVHMHANWAFTAPGTYDVTVQADAAVGGTPVTATAVYTFVVGELPEDVDTATSLEASATTLSAGGEVTLTADVTPAGVGGHVEFRDGATVLGHDELEAGVAELDVPGLAVGSHAVTAVFVPAVENLANTSTSDPVTITVTDGSGVAFGIAGIEDSYDVGDVLTATVVGHSLTEGQTYRWIIRPVGATAGGYVFSGTGTQAALGTLEQLLDARYDGYEIRVRLREGSAYVPGADTPWVPLVVDDAVEPVTTTFPAEPQYLGDDVVFPLQGRALTEGETVKLVYRSGSPWFDVPNSSQVGDTIVSRPPYATGPSDFSIQVIQDDVVLAQSSPVQGEIAGREVLVEGVRAVYRVGQTLEATAEVHPAKEGLNYHWATVEGVNLVTVKEGTGSEALTLELPMTLEWHDKPLYFFAEADDGAGGEIWTGQWSTTLKVSDSDPTTQLLFFQGIGGHYHQGGTINLNLVADPELADGDTINWEWKWPGTEWAPLPGASGLSHSLTAEQALEGVEVRGTLDFADSDETLVAEPVTIHVDDHGAAPRQQPTVGGETSYTEGEQVTLTRQLPENGPTVLTTHLWERQTPGSDNWTEIAGQTGPELRFSATAADDGARYRVSLLKPGGQLAYGPSGPHVLSVTAPPVPGEVTATTVTAAPVTQRYGQPAVLEVSVAPSAAGEVLVGLSGTTQKLTGTLVDGRASITVPAGLLEPGRRVLDIDYAGVAGTFAPSHGSAVVKVVKARPKVKVAPKARTVRRGAKAVLKVAVSAPGEVTATGQVAVKVAGQKFTVRLGKRGKATVRLMLPRGTKPGVKTVHVRYRGDARVATGRAVATIRVSP